MKTASVLTKALAVTLSLGGFVQLAQVPAEAAESAKGFYLLGSRSQFAGVLPGPGAYHQNDLYIYGGAAGANVELPLGGVFATDVSATVVLDLPTFMYFAPALGGLAGISITQPMGWQSLSASATFQTPNGPPISTSVTDDDFQFGDPVIQAIVGWNQGNWHWNISTGVNIPLGQWDQGSLVNLGFNRWAVDVTGSATYLDMSTGIEASAALGLTFNGDNLDRDYKTGTEMHVEWSLSQITSSGFSFGLAGYHYQQITGDSGSDAQLGAFKGRVTAIGPAFGLTLPVSDRVISAKFRGYYEFNVENRLEGVSAIATLAIPLQPANPAGQ
jgi:hypothetical protein